MDTLRTVRINGIVLDTGTPITYEGADVGKVIGNDIAGSKCVINSDIVYQLLKDNRRVSYSLEVIKN